MNIQDRFLEILSSDSREVFLVALGHRLGISMRDALGGEAAHGWRQAWACNEMMIAVWPQVWSAKEGGVTGYPDSEFLSILLEKADAGNVRIHLRSAIESALFWVDCSKRPK